jgi:excisionase family DNA binding protein
VCYTLHQTDEKGAGVETVERTQIKDWPASELVSVSEAMRLMGTYRMNVYRLMRSGRLPYIQIGRGHRAIPLSEIRRYQEEKRKAKADTG